MDRRKLVILIDRINAVEEALGSIPSDLKQVLNLLIEFDFFRKEMQNKVMILENCRKVLSELKPFLIGLHVGVKVNNNE